MADQINVSLNFLTNANSVTASIEKMKTATINIGTAAIKVDNAFTKTMTSIKTKLNSINVASISQNISNVATGFNSLAQPGINLSSSMADLSAITGLTGNKLKEVEGYARDSAKTFGGSAADGVESYKLILSQLSPEIAKQPAALQAMGNSVATLSKTMGGDAVAATEVLTTAMNQYQVSTTDPIKASKEMAVMMNIMAAGAKEGSAELPQIKSALEQSGLAAKTANVSFAETNAAIQVLDKAGKKGAEGGVALRNVMATLSEGRFLPKDVKAELQNAGININALGDRSKSLKERLEPLKKIMGDQALVTKLFGKENNAAALALISGTTEMGRLTGAIQGTNTAYEQAAVIMDSPAEKNKKLQAQLDNFKISLFNSTEGILQYASVVGNIANDFANLLPVFSGLGKGISFLTNTTKMQALWTGIVTKAQWLWNAALTANPIGLIIAAIAILISYVIVIINYWDQFGAAMSLLLGPIGFVIGAFMSLKDNWDSITAAFSGGGIIAGFKRIGIVMLDVLLKPVQQLLELIAKIPGLGGLAGSGAKSIRNLRQKMDLITPAETQKKAVKKVVENTISPATLPGGITPAGGKPEGKGKPTGKSNEAIATGGTKNNVINITINELNGIKTAVIEGSKDIANKAGAGIADELLRVLAMANTATG